MWPDPEQAAYVDVNDRAAASANRAHVDPWCLNRQADHATLVDDVRSPAHDQTRIEARSADVRGHDVVEAETACKLCRAFGAGYRAREDCLEWALLGLLESQRAASATRDEHGAAEAAVREALLEPLQVARHPWPDEGVDHGGAGPFVLAVLAGYLVRKRDRPVESFLTQRALGGELVRRVAVGVHERDRDRRHAFGSKRLERLSHIVFIDWCEDLAGCEHPLGYWEPEPARHERGWVLPEEVIWVVAIAAAHLEDVSEPRGREQPDDCAFALQKCVQADSRAVQEKARGAAPIGGHTALDRCDNALFRCLRRCRLFRDQSLAGRVVEEDQVGEGTSDIHSQACRQVRLLSIVSAAAVARS